MWCKKDYLDDHLFDVCYKHIHKSKLITIISKTENRNELVLRLWLTRDWRKLFFRLQQKQEGKKEKVWMREKMKWNIEEENCCYVVYLF